LKWDGFLEFYDTLSGNWLPLRDKYFALKALIALRPTLSNGMPLILLLHNKYAIFFTQKRIKYGYF